MKRLVPGTRLGAFRIEALLGAGGMGEVYRARDTKLNRDVAIKVLPNVFAQDPERLARFEREAQTLASLNHANIAQIHGLDEADGVRALVMELVEGETLAGRIAGAPIPIAETLPIALQLAGALEAAHEKGIVHRDLKPANVMITSDGLVKVLDFGLAKLVEASEAGRASGAALSDSPTMMASATGVILGTAAYMSPEQARGKPIDKRTDIWAFGCVLYEMLTGRAAVAGDTLSDTLAAILEREPNWQALPSATPVRVRNVLRRCLQKDPQRRLRDIGEARIVLDNSAADDTSSDVSEGTPVIAPQPLWRRGIPMVFAAVAAATVAGTVTWYLSFRPSTPQAVTRLPFTLPEGQAFTGTNRHIAAISPDGTQMLYVANNRLYLRSMSEQDSKVIQGTEGFQDVLEPAFSPDGRSVAFFAFADQTLKRIAVTGGAAVTICPADNPTGISWGPDGIVFGQGTKGIMRVSPNGRTPDVLVRVNEDEMADGPQLLPGGQHVLFTLATGSAPDRWDKAHVVLQSITSGERKTLIEGGSDARYVPTGHIVYALSGSVFAVAFDVRRLAVTGDPVLIVDGVRRAQGSASGAGVRGSPTGAGAADLSFSSTGSLIYVPGPRVAAGSGPLDIVLMDRKGVIEPLKIPSGPYVLPRAAPDGKRIAFGTDDGKEAIVWIYDLSGVSTMQRLTFGGNNRFPIWTADSKRVVFQSDRDGDLAIFWQPADNTGVAERLTKPEQGESHVPESWSPIDDMFLFSITKGSDVSLSTLSLRDRKATPFGAVHSSTPPGPVFSPDGRWVAYTSTERGATTIYVQPIPPTGAKYQLIAKGSDTPKHQRWSPDGKELFFNASVTKFEAVSITTQPTFAFGNPVALPKALQGGPAGTRTPYDVTAASKFLGLITAGQTEYARGSVNQIQVVLNWFEELRARVPVR